VCDSTSRSLRWCGSRRPSGFLCLRQVSGRCTSTFSLSRSCSQSCVLKTVVEAVCLSFVVASVRKACFEEGSGGNERRPFRVLPKFWGSRVVMHMMQSANRSPELLGAFCEGKEQRECRAMCSQCSPHYSSGRPSLSLGLDIRFQRWILLDEEKLLKSGL
jgi:hypothetical protein